MRGDGWKGEENRKRRAIVGVRVSQFAKRQLSQQDENRQNEYERRVMLHNTGNPM